MNTTDASTSNGRDGRAYLIDEPGVARALRTILIAALASSLVVALFTAALGWRLVPVLSCLAAAGLAVGLVLDHFGRKRAGIVVGLTAAGYAALHAAAFHGGLQNVGLVLIPLLLVVGGLVLPRFALVLFAAGAIAAVGGMVLVEHLVLHKGQLNTGDLGDFVIVAVICAVAALVGRIIASRIDEGIRLTRASERRYRRIFENTQEVYFEMRPDGAVIEVNPAGASLFQTAREKIVGASLGQFFFDAAEFATFLAEVVRSGRVTNRELGMRDATGAPVHVLINATFRRNEAEPGDSIIGSIRDISGRRRAEEARRETEERLRLALDAAGAGIFEFHSRSGAMLSDRAHEHFGIPAGTEVAPRALLEAIHPDDHERVRRAYYDSAPPGAGQLAIEFRVRGAETGQERWLAVRARWFLDAENQPTRIIGTTLDVTERKSLEEQLRRRVEELQTVMDVAPVALFTAEDPECRVITGNAATYKMIGAPAGSNLSVTDMTGVARSWRILVNGEAVSDADLPIQAAARGQDVRNCEMQIELRDGNRRVFWGSASQLRDASGHARGAIGAFLDITQMRQQAEDILRESETRFQSTADACPVIIWFGDRDKRTVFVNKQGSEFTGLSAEELLADGWRKAIHPDDLEYTRGIYVDAAERRAGYQLEYRVRRGDGEYRHMLGTTRPRYFGKEYAGQIGSVIDITDVKTRQEETLARQKMESIGILASGVAHDFNNLLGSVLVQSEAALATIEAGQPPHQELKAIGDIAARGAEIVRQLTIYAGQEDNKAGPIDVSRTVEDILELVRISIPKNAALKADLAAALPAVAADASQIRQIVLNLVTNACEALAGQEGTIGVATRRVVAETPSEGAFGDQAPRVFVELSVCDTGCGVPPEQHAKLFDPFFSTKGAGRGLGLPVVHGIVRSLNGSITVESGCGAGTRARVLLPRAPVQTSFNDWPRDTERSAAPQQVSILVVEDEYLLRQAVVQILRKRGFVVTEACDGTAALEALRGQDGAPDAVLLDITLPGASSRDVLTAANSVRPPPKVIVTSAYSREYAAEHLDTDPQYFIRKPFRATQLADLVIEAVGRAPNRPN